MFNFMMTASFKKVVETDKIALYVGIRIGDRVTNSCLSSKIYNNCNIVSA